MRGEGTRAHGFGGFVAWRYSGWLCLLLGLATPGRAAESGKAALVPQATDVIERWRPEQHLYVKGDLGVSAELLDGLERWLDDHGSNWTVVLLESAADERYRDVGGQAHTGMDAVEHALGKGLSNRTGFGQLTDGRTGEANGAFFILFLKERKFSYFGSTVQDRRGLGESAWQGSLDRAAIAAMRDGGRILDAVKDTVSSINSRLDQKLAQEKAMREQRAEQEQRMREQRAAEERAAAERQRTRAEAAIAGAKDGLSRWRTALAEVERKEGKLPDGLVMDLPVMEVRLTNSIALAGRGGYDQARAEAESVLQQANRGLERIRQRQAVPEQLATVQGALASLEGKAHADAARAQFQRAREELALAEEAYAHGDPAATIHVNAGAGAVTAAERVMASSAESERLVRLVWMTGAGASVVGVLLLGLILSLRRRGVKAEAEKLYAEWEQALTEKQAALVEMLEKTSTLLGSNRAEATGRFEGSTLELAEGIIRDVDELFIMAACAGRVLRDAGALLRASGAASRLRGQFSCGPYRRAIALLRDEPVVFRPEESLEMVIRGKRQAWDRLLGDVKYYQPFQMSFNSLMAGFQERAGRAVSGLQRFEACLGRVDGLLAEGRRVLAQARAGEADLAKQGEADRRFLLTEVFARTLPEVEERLERATAKRYADPVGVAEGSGLEAGQAAAAIAALVEGLSDYRRRLQPSWEEAVVRLREQGIACDWVGAALNGFSAQADAAGAAALDAAGSGAVTALREEMEGFGRRLSEVVRLDEQRRGPAAQRLTGARARVTSARAELGKRLGLDPSRLLREEGAEPEPLLASAEEQLAALRAALDRGDVAAGQGSLEALLGATDSVVALAEKTLTTAAQNEEILAARKTETARLLGLLPEHGSMLAQLKGAYAPTALVLGAGDPSHPGANGTVADNLEEAQEHLQESQKLTREAESGFAAGGILRAAAWLERVRAHQEGGALRLREIVEKRDRLQRTDADNAKRLQELRARRLELSAAVADSRVRQSTLAAWAQAEGLPEDAAALMQARPSDPFAVARRLEEAERALGEIAAGIRADHELHAETSRSLEAAAGQLATAERWASQAASDGLADSEAIARARARVEELRASLEGCRQRLGSPHANWEELDAAVDRLGAEAAREGATLRGELQRAESAVQALSTAVTAVRGAAGWRGSYGVGIVDSGWSRELARARSSLEMGDYEAAGRLAGLALQAAQQAVLLAEQEVRRRQRAEEEERERARRRREQAEAERRRRQESSQTSFGSGGISGGGFSSGSGSRQSSFSSGSGVSRSGW